VGVGVVVGIGFCYWVGGTSLLCLGVS